MSYLAANDYLAFFLQKITLFITCKLCSDSYRLICRLQALDELKSSVQYKKRPNDQS